jgi:hypothetical protein
MFLQFQIRDLSAWRKALARASEPFWRKPLLPTSRRSRNSDRQALLKDLAGSLSV